MNKEKEKNPKRGAEKPKIKKMMFFLPKPGRSLAESPDKKSESFFGPPELLVALVLRVGCNEKDIFVLTVGLSV